MDIIKLYCTNEDFREYVNRYCKHYTEGKPISIAEACTHRIVWHYAEQCLTKDERKVI